MKKMILIFSVLCITTLFADVLSDFMYEIVRPGSLNLANDPIYWDVSKLQKRTVSLGTVVNANMNAKNDSLWYVYMPQAGIIVEVLLKIIPLDREIKDLPLRVQADIQEIKRDQTSVNTMFKVYTRVLIEGKRYTREVAFIERKQELFKESIKYAGANVVEVGATREGDPVIFLENVTDMTTGYRKNVQLEIDIKDEIDTMAGMQSARRR